MKKIISPYCQYRQNIGTHSNWKNKSYTNQEQQNSLIKKLASRPGLHSGNVQRQEMAQCIIQFIALLSSLHNCDALSKCIQDPDIKLKRTLPDTVEVNNIDDGTRNNHILTILTQPFVHILQRTDQIVSQYDPFRFPMAEAVPAPYTKKAKTLSVDFSDRGTHMPIPISDFNKTEFICSKNFTKFKKIKKFISEGKFYNQNIEGSKSAINYMKVSYKGKNYIIKENSPEEYYLFDPNSVTSHADEAPVYFKKNGKISLGISSYNFFYQIRNTAIPISDFNKGEFTCGRFVTLNKISKFYPEGKFYDPDIGGPESAINYMKVRYKGKNHIIKENNPGEYYLFDPNLPRTLESHIPIYFKTKDGKVHLGTDMPRNKKLCHSIRKGHCYIKIFDNLYLSNYNWETNRQEIVVADGYLKSSIDPITQSKINIWQPLTPQFIELYKKPNSNQPIKKHYGIPAFSDEEKNIINRISVNTNKDYVYITQTNDAPERYGAAKIYSAERANDTSRPILGQFIKINKKLVPVYTLIVIGEGIYYEIHDDEEHHQKAYPLQYVHSYTGDDGNNWIFKRI